MATEFTSFVPLSSLHAQLDAEGTVLICQYCFVILWPAKNRKYINRKQLYHFLNFLSTRESNNIRKLITTHSVRKFFVLF